MVFFSAKLWAFSGTEIFPYLLIFSYFFVYFYFFILKFAPGKLTLQLWGISPGYRKKDFSSYFFNYFFNCEKLFFNFFAWISSTLTWRWQKNRRSVTLTLPAQACLRIPRARLVRPGRVRTLKTLVRPTTTSSWVKTIRRKPKRKSFPCVSETRCLRCWRVTTGRSCLCRCASTARVKANPTSKDPWTRSWCGLKLHGESWPINTHTCTTQNSAKPLANFGGRLALVYRSLLQCTFTRRCARHIIY